MNRLTNLKSLILIPLALACFGPSPTAQAVVPPPDGGYPNSNTAEGHQALLSLTTGFGNTAVGFEALMNDTAGGGNTATGLHALKSNTIGTSNTFSRWSALRLQRFERGEENTERRAFLTLTPDSNLLSGA